MLPTLAVLATLWFLLHFKRSRPDGDPVRVHPYRRIMFFLMPTRTESVVLFDSHVDPERLLAWLERVKDRCGADITHATVAAAMIGLAEVPRMNRFVAGDRLYQRRGRWVTFSMRRKRADKEAALSTVKLCGVDGESFKGLCERINARVGEERSGKKTSADKEFALLDALPRPVFRLAMAAVRAADRFNLLPGAFIRQDPLYTGIFVANLGAVKMGPGYHHLFEYGTCPLFLMVGQVEEVAAVVEGAVVAKRRLHLRFTYDDRIDDGLNARFGIDAVKRVLEDPERWLGGHEDGADFPIGVGAA